MFRHVHIGDCEAREPLLSGEYPEREQRDSDEGNRNTCWDFISSQTVIEVVSHKHTYIHTHTHTHVHVHAYIYTQVRTHPSVVLTSLTGN